VVLVQSTQPLTSGSYCWDDPTIGLSDLLSYYRQVSQKYEIDPERVIIAGFSQGSGMAIFAALSKKMPARGFIGVGTFLGRPELLTPLARQARSIRGYFITGKKDNTLENIRAIRIFEGEWIQFAGEVHPGARVPA
jgi:predicted esterase